MENQYKSLFSTYTKLISTPSDHPLYHESIGFETSEALI